MNSYLSVSDWFNASELWSLVAGEPFGAAELAGVNARVTIDLELSVDSVCGPKEWLVSVEVVVARVTIDLELSVDSACGPNDWLVSSVVVVTTC